MSVNFRNASVLNKRLAHLPPKTFVVGFYINNASVSQDEWMNKMATVLRGHGYFTVGIATPQSASLCDLDACDITATIPTEKLETLAGINVFIVSDMDATSKYPAKSRVLGFPHAFGVYIDSNFSNQLSFYQLLDGWVTPSPITPQTRKLTTDLYAGYCTQDFYARKSPYFYFIPSAYPRFTRLAEEISAANAQPDAIVYAPIGMYSSREHGVDVLPDYGVRLIRILLDNFRGLNLIFRPYKNDLDTPIVKEICQKFADEPRFILDNSPGRLFSFSHAVCLITDYSHIGISFAFTTLRPAIFFLPWENAKQEKNTYSLAPYGFKTWTFSTLLACIRKILDDKDSVSERLLKTRDLAAMPGQGDFDRIASWLPDFYNDRPRPEWLSIPRNDMVKTLDEMDLLAKYIRFMNPTLFSIAARHRSPASPLLCAAAAHIGKIIRPEMNLAQSFQKLLSNLLDKDIEATRYADVETADVNSLYSLALLQYIKKGAPKEHLSYIENLFNDFKKRFQA